MSNNAADDNSNVLVLGATSAIAFATSRLLAEKGAMLYLVGRSRERLEVVGADLEVRGARGVELDTIDLADTSAHVPMLLRAERALGRIDVVIIAYGILRDQRKAEQSFEFAAEVIDVNFRSVISLLTWLGNYMERQGRGVLVVLSSVAGDRGRKSNYVYGASKAGLNVFLDGLRARTFRRGIHVVTVRPGFVSSPMTSHLQQTRLFASPEVIAIGIIKAIKNRKDIVYLPQFWSFVMFLIRSVPTFIFKRLNL